MRRNAHLILQTFISPPKAHFRGNFSYPITEWLFNYITFSQQRQPIRYQEKFARPWFRTLKQWSGTRDHTARMESVNISVNWVQTHRLSTSSWALRQQAMRQKFDHPLDSQCGTKNCLWGCWCQQHTTGRSMPVGTKFERKKNPQQASQTCTESFGTRLGSYISRVPCYLAQYCKVTLG